MVVRTWNVNLGNTVPPGRRSHLRAMVELITTGNPDVVCLQEVPAWALGRVGEWAGMQAASARATRPRLGPIPIPAGLAHLLARPHSGRLAPRFTGEGNAILVPPDATIRSVKTLTLNTNIFCEERGEELGLSEKEVRAWQRPRRVCHLVQYELPNRKRLLIATLHATNRPDDIRLPDAELRRAINFIERRAEVEETVVLAGDFNVSRAQSEVIGALEALPPEFRWDDKGAHVDHVLVHGASPTAARVWPREERVRDGRLLSDHYPIEVELPLR